VVPSTNVTVFSLQYQSYLNDIFHTTWPARAGHFVCMPLITGLVIAGLGATVGGALAVLLAAWWLAWGIRARLPLWGVASAAWAGAIYAGARWFAASHGLPAIVGWAAALSFVQAASHAPEPTLPPRVTRSNDWVPIAEYLLGRPGARRSLGARALRGLHLVEITLYGTIDEFMASPRLAPIQLLEVLWRLGYAPSLRREWKALSARATASGDAALDYIGVGGGTTLDAVPPLAAATEVSAAPRREIPSPRDGAG